MRAINLAVWHCSADEEGVNHHISYYDKMHRNRKPPFRKIAYHIVIYTNGLYDFGREIWEIGAHAKGYNRNSIGIMYVGGLKDGKPSDTRTVEQIKSMRNIKKMLDYMYPGIKHVGHRDLSVDLNGDGVISKNEWMKACPSFDVETQF